MPVPHMPSPRLPSTRPFARPQLMRLRSPSRRPPASRPAPACPLDRPERLRKEPVSRNKFRKTKMCKFFEAGKCRKRTSCNFAHSEAEMKPLPDLRRTKLCPSVLEGGVHVGLRTAHLCIHVPVYAIGSGSPSRAASPLHPH